MRIIDADELEKKMYHEAFEVDSELQMWNSGCWIRYKLFEKCLENTPTIDAAYRPQGEWKHLKGDEWLCSNCGHVVWTEGSWEHPLERGKDYCEHCGARMKQA